jgi:hypothetical protein
MFASYVSRDHCQLYNVVRTDMQTGEVIVLRYPPSDMQTAVHRAAYYQQEFDPTFSRYDYRMGMCS